MAKKRTPIMALPDEFLTCRQRHSWVFIGFFYGEDSTIVSVHICDRCETKCYTFYDSGMNRLHSRYVWPKGYSIKGGVDRVQVRQELFKRVKPLRGEVIP